MIDWLTQNQTRNRIDLHSRRRDSACLTTKSIIIVTKNQTTKMVGIMKTSQAVMLIVLFILAASTSGLSLREPVSVEKKKFNFTSPSKEIFSPLTLDQKWTITTIFIAIVSLSFSSTGKKMIFFLFQFQRPFANFKFSTILSSWSNFHRFLFIISFDTIWIRMKCIAVRQHSKNDHLHFS